MNREIQTERLQINSPIKSKLLSLVILAMAPLLIIVIYLIFSLLNYSKAYEEIVSNLTIANDYNVSFKNDINESIYKLVVGHVDLKTVDEQEVLQDPDEMIEVFQSDINFLMSKTEGNSRSWLQRLNKNLNSLHDKVDMIKNNLDEGGHYDTNVQMLDSDIYILTDLIQDDLQHFVMYQTEDIESIREELHHKVTFFIIFWAAIVVVIVTFVVIMAIYMVRNITKPLDELVEATGKIADGDFKSKLELSSDDEIMVLADSVNDMTDKLDIMVDTIKEDEKKMRYAELRLLQEQINPHFLYNTLDTIVWLVESNDNEKAIDVVMSLSKLFRLVLSKGQELISIRDEEEHIKNYLSIQQVRYNDILEYSIDIDKELYRYEIQKLTLQPLVENSLYHGIKYKRAKGIIEVIGRKDGNEIVLTIKDDGVGMDTETLNGLREKISKKCKDTDSGFGLANVNERIRMYFGEEYGMTINSALNEGTEIVIRIPAIMYKASKDNVYEENK